MKTYKCKSYKSLSGIIDNILLFGLVHPVIPYSDKAEEQAEKRGLSYYCNAIDKDGNTYKLFTDYDPALCVSRRLAIMTKGNG